MFRFKQFEINDEKSAMKIGTDGVLLGAWAIGNYTPQHIIDAGCGTGLVSLMLAQRFANARITGIEIDPDSADEARANTAHSPWHDRIEIVTGDLLEYIPATPVDAIVSNPPFFTQPLVSPDGRRALARHGDTLTPDTLITYAARTLRHGGRLAMIVPDELTDNLIYRMQLNRLDVCRVTHVSPTVTSMPVRVLAEAVAGLATSFSETTLPIRDKHGYTPAYKRLTGDFYLNSTFN